MSKRILSITDGSHGRSHRSNKSPEQSSDNVPRKRKSRWSAATEVDRTFIPGMPTQLPPNLSAEQERMYIIQLQIEDISRRLKCGDLGIPKNPDDRSPSPEPIYSCDGKRLNTREYRTRKKLEDERHALVQQLMELNPEYKPPTDYKPQQNRITDKVFIPQEDHPDINFVGLLIGPRGNTLKSLEKDTGAKIIIRGKGSIKDGKLGRRDGLPLPGEDEPLHAYITAPFAEAVDKAVKKINEIIRQGIEVPESQNDLRRQQLRELALLNGTLRTHEGLLKLRAMAEAQSIATNNILCAICGGAGHLSSDCKAAIGGQAYFDQMNSNPNERAKMDSEYTALMAELGVTGSHFMVGNASKAQINRAPRQPPPPGVAPLDDDDHDPVTSLNGTNPGFPTITTSNADTSASMTSDQYAFSLPPPPPPPGHYPMWPGAAAVPYPVAAPGYVPPANGIPAYGNYPISTDPASNGQVWQAPVPAGAVIPGAPMVTSYYMPASADYWAGYQGNYACNPPPPPPPPPGL